MDIRGKIAVVTGAASGIGAALCRRLHKSGAQTVVCVDRNALGAQRVADEIGGQAFAADVADDTAMSALIHQIETEIGPIDLFVSNAGVFIDGGPERSTADWQMVWDINVMSHVIAARHILPRMISRGGGYLLNTASAAGLLNQVGAAPYAVSKHAAVGFAEWLALTHGDDGIKVSVLCPQAVETPMIADDPGTADMDGMISPETVAEACIQGLRDETFLILPHPQVATYMRRKVDDYDRWIGGMRKLNKALRAK